MEPWRLSVSPGLFLFPTGNFRQAGCSQSISKTSPTSNISLFFVPLTTASLLVSLSQNRLVDFFELYLNSLITGLFSSHQHTNFSYLSWVAYSPNQKMIVLARKVPTPLHRILCCTAIFQMCLRVRCQPQVRIT